MTRSNRTLIAVILFVLAGFIITNLLVTGSQLNDWLLPVILLGIGLVLALYPQDEAVTEAEITPHTALPSAVKPEPVAAARKPVTTPQPVASPAQSTSDSEVEARQVEVEENPWATTKDIPEPVAAIESTRPAEQTPVVDAGGGVGVDPSAGPDDLTVVEGIGKKMSAALVAAEINTFAKLAAATEDDIRAAIKAAGMRLAPSIPTWSKQAGFAARGDWDGLQAYQSTLVGGREVNG